MCNRCCMLMRKRGLNFPRSYFLQRIQRGGINEGFTDNYIFSVAGPCLFGNVVDAPRHGHLFRSRRRTAGERCQWIRIIWVRAERVDQDAAEKMDRTEKERVGERRRREEEAGRPKSRSRRGFFSLSRSLPRLLASWAQRGS